MFEIRTLLILIPSLPLLAAVVTAVLGPRVLRERSHWPAVVGIAGAFLCSLLLALQLRGQIVSGESDETADDVGYSEIVTLWTWANVPQAYDQDESLVPVRAQPGASDGQRDLQINVTLRADALTVVMLVMVTLVSTLVTVYSIGYMHGERGYWRFFAYVSLFVFSMTMLVSVSNFVLLYVFWEAVGVCSYLLIGFWYEKPEAAAAGKKAFLVNRVGDFGFALALFLIWTCYGTLNFHDMDGVAGVLGQTRLAAADGFVTGWPALAICLLLLLGACGKSAQFPLHVWLPDAMEGPTPVSALIHAATMVTAGIYMVARCTPLFMASPDAQLVVAGIGAGTALMAGVIALTQYDLKRVLAYSTISQLGYMFLGLGVGSLAGITAGMFHLFTHAFFKALLFLGAGSVMHAMGGVIDIRRFGGLRRLMPITCWTFLIGCLALAGMFPLAGFWSKDSILGAVHDQAHEMQVELARRHTIVGHDPIVPESLETLPTAFALESNEPRLSEASWLVSHPVSSVADGHGEAHVSGRTAELSEAQLSRGSLVYQWLYYIGLVTALLTAIYTFRAFFLTFFGEEEIPREAGHHAHEAPRSMWVPLAILAVFAAIAGFAFEWWGFQESSIHPFSDALATTPSLAYPAVQATAQPGVLHGKVAVVSALIAMIGIGVAAYLYLGPPLEVARLRYVLEGRWLERLTDFGWVSRLSAIPIVVGVRRGSDAIGLGWVARFVGYLLLLVIGVLISPCLVGYYLSPYRLSRDKFYWDEIYDVIVVKPLRGLAAVSYLVDRYLVDGLVNACGWIPKAIGAAMRGLQVGLVSFYGLATVLGLLTLLAARILWGGG